MSVCDEGGRWSAPSLLCTRTSDASVTLHHQDEIIHEEDRKTLLLFPVPEILCGNPPLPPHSGQMWNGSSTPGSPVFYYCKKGFHHDEGTNMSLCTSSGSWTQPGISCKGKNALTLLLFHSSSSTPLSLSDIVGASFYRGHQSRSSSNPSPPQHHLLITLFPPLSSFIHPPFVQILTTLTYFLC